MSEYVVTRKSDGVEMVRYSASNPQEVNGFDLVDYDHTEWSPDSAQVVVNPDNWKIYVGSFLDRFGAAKLSILSDPDPVIQAVIKDASVRKYIDLLGRRAELEQVIGLLNYKGHSVDVAAILDVEPTAEEIWHG